VLLHNLSELLGRGIKGVTADLFRDRLGRLLLSRLPQGLPEETWW